MHDVVIVGAGPVGATLALALRDSDLDVVVLDARAKGQSLRGDRSLALSHGARLILERQGVWQELATVPGAVTPITDIDVSQSGGFGMTRLSAADVGLPALGYVASYRALQAALDAALLRAEVPVRHEASVTSVGATAAYAAVEQAGGDRQPLVARLVAIADGTGGVQAGASRQRHDYDQVALVAKVGTDPAPDGIAWERFASAGPIALLPEGDHYGLVWTMSPELADKRLIQEDASFLKDLAHQFGSRLPRLTSVADRRTFPLVLEFAWKTAGTRCVALGNAAQTLHPVAGQGFNVGLRDAYGLALAILDSPREEIGTRAMLHRYVGSRRIDRTAGIAFTHGLVGIFGSDAGLLRWPRGLALTFLDAVPPVKRAFSRAMMFGLR
jgi:2-octaprenyl-6-methoxyphenol hydroxylase